MRRLHTVVISPPLAESLRKPQATRAHRRGRVGMDSSAGQSWVRGSAGRTLRMVLSIVILVPTLTLFGLVYTSTSDQKDFADLEHQGTEYLSALLPVEIALIDAQA